jgi:release factor glutamine methyltransferase
LPKVRLKATGSGAIALALAQTLQTRAFRQHLGSRRQPGVGSRPGQRATQLALDVIFSPDWFGHQRPFDLIVSNPPYIAEADPHLA